MTENTPVFNGLPKPVFANDTGVTKDDMFVKSFKEAVEGGLSVADAEMSLSALLSSFDPIAESDW